MQQCKAKGNTANGIQLKIADLNAMTMSQRNHELSVVLSCVGKRTGILLRTLALPAHAALHQAARSTL